jgi:hypothetical protein
MLAMTTLDEEMLDDIQKIAPAPAQSQEEPVFKNPFDTYKADASFSYGGYGIPFAGNKTPPYGPTTTYPKSPESKTPEYQATSPAFAPSSPMYGASSPVYPRSPIKSTTFTPSSPPYIPESPPAAKPTLPLTVPEPMPMAEPMPNMMLEEGEVEKPKSILKGLLNRINGIKENDL